MRRIATTVTGRLLALTKLAARGSGGGQSRASSCMPCRRSAGALSTISIVRMSFMPGVPGVHRVPLTVCVLFAQRSFSFVSGWNRRRRRLFDTTKTELKAIAAPASIGFSSPAAASGRAATL
jgi:hypothetical protein